MQIPGRIDRVDEYWWLQESLSSVLSWMPTVFCADGEMITVSNKMSCKVLALGRVSTQQQREEPQDRRITPAFDAPALFQNSSIDSSPTTCTVANRRF